MPKTIPQTLAETIPALDAMLHPDARKQIQEAETAEEVHSLAIAAHHGLGRHLRNTWGLWGDNDSLKAELRAAGVTHPDDMSHHILLHYSRAKIATRHQRIAEDE